MDSTPAHRKRVRHFHEPDHCHSLTFSCYKRMPLLTNDVWRAMLCQAIDRATAQHGYRTAAFVLMPEHVHLLIFPDPNAGDIDRLLNAIKRPYSYRVKQLLLKSNRRLLDRLTIQQRPGVKTFRYWQEGPGYDRNLVGPTMVMKSIDYLHNNPVRRGLVDLAIDWKWSSARHFLLPDATIEPTLPTISKLPAEFLNGLPND